MKKKTQGTITSVIGAVILFIAVAMIFATYFLEEYTFTPVEWGTLLGIGYVFLRADDELIQRLIFRNKNNEK
jgi:hypothetical protein